MTAKMIIKQALKLDEKERKLVCSELEKSLDSRWLDPDLPEWQKLELERRLKDERENPDDVVTWESVRKKLARQRRSK